MQQRTAQGHMDNEIHIDWESVQVWVEKVLGKGRLAEIGVAAAFLTILGFSTFAFHNALQNYQVVGPGFF